MSYQFQIQKATKSVVKARLALIGPSGSGKTYSALQIATGLADGGRIVVLDTEHGSACMYANEFDFDTLQLPNYSPETYTAAINHCVAQGYKVIIIDSLSHAWTGKDGALEQVDKAAAREKGNTFAGWRHVTPMHNQMIETMIGAGAHLIVTMRSKVEYVIETVNGKSVPKKVGMQPIQREGMEFEFDVVGDMDQDHQFVISKTRLRFLDGAVIAKPGPDLGQAILNDIMSGAAEPLTQHAAPATEHSPFDETSVLPPKRLAPLEPEQITSLDQFKQAMIAIGITTSEQMAAAKIAIGLNPDDKLKDMDIVTLQAIYATALAKAEEVAA